MHHRVQRTVQSINRNPLPLLEGGLLRCCIFKFQFVGMSPRAIRHALHPTNNCPAARLRAAVQISVCRSAGSNALFLSRQEKSQKKPSKGCCRAQRINNTMVAGGNHTIISATSKSRPLYNPQPHRHPAFKNVPIFERFHVTNLQVCSAEPAENRDIFSGRWQKRREGGPGRGCICP